MSHPELFVLRHGETEWNVEGRLQGALDSPLTVEGRKQAVRQAAILQGTLLTAPIFTSPQGRALETAHIVAQQTGAELFESPLLREISMGDWDGKLVSEVAPDAPDDPVLWKFEAPNGERLHDLKARLVVFLKGLDGPAVVVTHGVTSRVLRAMVLGIPENALAAMPGGQGVIFHLRDGVYQKLT